MKHKVQKFIGKTPESVMNDLDITYIIRIIGPDTPVASGLNHSRINLVTDKDNIIKKVWFG